MGKLVRKTLLVDDSDIDLFVQRRFLEVCNFSDELLFYKSVDEALCWLRNTNGESAPDIIFLDLNMPEKDGFSFLKSFSALPSMIKEKSKIAILTSSGCAKDREKAFAYENVIQFITKPLGERDIAELKGHFTKSSFNGPTTL
ncbi:MAG: response regulator [Cyclobacteriaceae bacterium]|jgi:two-component system nitrate/nitrite response regulator NarL|nr:response regulator [Cyclobacteriaceae bacterium]MDH4298383.1 response regulator [Cyclobacteriaceae bacterium]MDH5250642.1 response regulator [Cyclobacteriaceae bacterium]